MTRTVQGTDADVKAAVVEELAWIPSVDSAHIGVSVDDGAVTLSGVVGSYPEKVLAGKAAQRVRGVTAIVQCIEVHVAGGAPGDQEIARDAGRAIARAVDVPDSVKVSVHGHVVTLSGEVNRRYECDAAERAVRYVPGVTAVADVLTIAPAVMEAGCREAITSALVRNARVESSHITVTTGDGGLVVLEGTVASLAERRQAELACWAARGVMDVTDNLVVR